MEGIKDRCSEREGIVRQEERREGGEREEAGGRVYQHHISDYQLVAGEKRQMVARLAAQ